ncbi:hypothetical protein GCM10027403_18070 [Arthrobacter tecti]
MTLSPEEYSEFIRSHADGEGRLPALTPKWSTFPFDAGILPLKPWQDPVFPEPERSGLTPDTCDSCADRDQGIWLNDNWRLFTREPTGLPVALMLQPRDHYDYADLPDDLAAEMGVILRHLAAAVEGMENMQQVHMDRWGASHAHLHWFITGRPTGQLQLRGTFCGIWELLLPPLPQDVIDAHSLEVARRLQASFGGSIPSEVQVEAAATS